MPEVVIALYWMAPAIVVWMLVRRPSDRSVAAFAKTYVVPLTPHNVGQLRRYIAWTRRWRIGGAVIALTAAAALSTTRGDPVGNPWLPLVVGYSLGSLVGELVRPVEHRDGPQLATLQRRRIVDFVKIGSLVALVVGALVAVALAIVLLATNPRRGWVESSTIQDPSRPQDWYIVALTAIVVLSLGLVWFGGRALARAPMPADSIDRQAVRHAIRSAAMLSLVGGSALVIGAVIAKLGNIVSLLARSNAPMVQVAELAPLLGVLLATWGALLTLTSVPRFGIFSGRLPLVPEAESTVRA